MLYSLYLYFFKKYSKKQRYFYFFIVAIFFLDAVGYFLRYQFKLNQIYFYLPVTFISILYFGFFYSFDYKKTKYYNLFLKILVFISLFSLIIIQINEKPMVLSSKSLLVLILFQLFVSLQWFWYIINHTDEQNIENKQAFWVSCALLMWSVFALFRFLPIYELVSIDSEFYSIIAIIFSFINIIAYLFYLKALKCVDYNILRSFNHF